MNVAEWFSNNITRSRRLETVVRKYGADFISTYGAGLLAAVGALTLPAGGALFTIPAAIGLVCGVNKLTHDYREIDLLDAFRDQIASALKDPNNPMGHRDPETLTVSDMRNYAFGEGACSNNLLKCELEDNDRRMTTSIGLHALSGVLFGAGAMVLFQQLDRVVTDVGRTVLDVNKPSAYRGIMELSESLHKGLPVTELQVFSIRVNGDEELRAEIQKEHGYPFVNMYLDDKLKVLKQYSARMRIPEITEQLRSGVMEAEDLILAHCNQPPAMRHPATAKLRLVRANENDSAELAYSTALLDALAEKEREWVKTVKLPEPGPRSL